MKKLNRVFRDNLLRLMEETGMNETKLAEKLNSDRTSVYKYTSGRRFPRTPTLWMMARILGTTIDELMEGYTENDYYEELEIT